MEQDPKKRTPREKAALDYVQRPEYTNRSEMELGIQAFIAGVEWSVTHYYLIIDLVTQLQRVRAAQKSYFGMRTDLNKKAAIIQETRLDELLKHLVKIGAIKPLAEIPEIKQGDMFNKKR
jgi:hypothetical protein